MIVTPIKTYKVLPGTKLLPLLDCSLPKLEEKNVVVITSKIVSICQGRVVPDNGKVTKEELIKKEADVILAGAAIGRYGVYLTIKNNTLIANAGIDQSNSGGYFVLWPKEPFKEAAKIWNHLREKRHLKHLGILITDSHTTPLRWGTRGLGLAWCGFEPLKNYIGAPDVFGRKLRMTKGSLLDGLAAAAVVVMGEGNEQTPLAVITEAPVTFQTRPPTEREIASLRIEPEDDLYAPLLHTNTKKP